MISQKCIKCNKEMLKIVYGYPTPDFNTFSKDLGLYIGGCTPGPITHFCKECSVSWSIDLGYDDYS